MRELPKFTGWCTEEKARLLMDFIYEVQPIQCVEIGVFGGSTTFPMVRALQFLDRGILYAVDSWSNQEAIAGVALQDPNRTWWAEVDLKRIQKTFLLTFTKKRLSKWCRVISKTSKEAFLSFQDNFFDMVYLDGNFSSQGALEDAQLALIKTKKGGYIWLNDSDSDDFLYLDGHQSEERLFSLVCSYFPKLKEEGVLLLNVADSYKTMRSLVFLMERMERVSSFSAQEPYLLLKRKKALEAISLNVLK